jgi:hypothetical protein
MGRLRKTALSGGIIYTRKKTSELCS